MLPVEVRITKNAGKFVPSHNPVTLNKSKGHVVHWYNDTEEQITISFGGGTPFPKHMNPYVIASGKFGQSGSIEGAPGTWTYGIGGASGTTITPDSIPEVIIQP
jgi:hypothetical protein